MCLSVGLSIGSERVFERTAHSIEKPFRVIGRVGSRNHVSDEGPNLEGNGQILWGMGWRNVPYRENVAAAIQ